MLRPTDKQLDEWLDFYQSGDVGSSRTGGRFSKVLQELKIARKTLGLLLIWHDVGFSHSGIRGDLILKHYGKQLLLEIAEAKKEAAEKENGQG